MPADFISSNMGLIDHSTFDKSLLLPLPILSALRRILCCQPTNRKVVQIATKPKLRCGVKTNRASLFATPVECLPSCIQRNALKQSIIKRFRRVAVIGNNKKNLMILDLLFF